MQKSEAVAILMQLNLTEITFLFPQDMELDTVRSLPPDEIFSDLSVSFLSALSSVLTKNQLTKSYPDVATFAFFCRKANILANKRKYEGDAIRLGRGVVFHITPSNVPVNFGYSMVAGILSGDVNIVRVPSEHFEQVDIICRAIEQVTDLPEFVIFKKRLFLVRYDRQSSVTTVLSSLCDVRIIWGGDETIAQIRQSVLPPRSFDVTFADRYSLAAINADALINETNLGKLAEGFYNDTYLFDQNACSAPRLVLWTGTKENIIEGKNLFWEAVQKRLEQYKLSSILSMDKLSALYWQSTQCEGIQRVKLKDNKLWRIHISNLSPDIDKYRCAGGYFLEYEAASLNELKEIVNRKYQTLAYYGYSREELSDFVKFNRLNGIDRIVPFGKTTDFDLVWDGYDLIRSLSRECSIG
jgi:hypothetical protein